MLYVAAADPKLGGEALFDGSCSPALGERKKVVVEARRPRQHPLLQQSQATPSFTRQWIEFASTASAMIRLEGVGSWSGVFDFVAFSAANRHPLRRKMP